MFRRATNQIEGASQAVSGPSERPGEPTLAERRALLRKYGTFTLAYSAVHQPFLRYFGDANGFIAWKRSIGTVLALADPIAPPDRRAHLIERFLDLRPDAAFCQVSEETAEILAARGLYVTPFGPDTRIDLKDYTFDGKDKRNLRAAYNRVAVAGYTLAETTVAEIGADAIERVSLAWRGTRTVKSRETYFLNRPIVFADELDVRKFFALDASGRLVAFAFFDPMYRDGEIIGYSTSFRRQIPEAEPRVGQALIRFAIEEFQKNGLERVMLGVSPFAVTGTTHFKQHRRLAFITRQIFESRLINRYIYSLQGHAEHKRDFRGEQEMTYFATRSRIAERRMLAMFVATKIFQW